MPEQEITVTKGRYGARWINEQPSSEEFAAWFKESVTIDAALKHEDYVGGIVLIPAVDEKKKHVEGFQANGAPRIVVKPEMAFIPYPKVETRIQYFWDLMGAHADEWVGVIEPIETPRPSIEPTLIELHEELAAATGLSDEQREAIEDEVGIPRRTRRRETYRPSRTAQIVHMLPPGFFLLPVPLGETFTHFLCCSYRVAVYEKANLDGRPTREGRGTKMVPLLLGRDTKYPDQNAIMKAETGAIGRAIAFAGIFNIPGSGVATAEDMIEAMAGERAAPSDTSEDNGGSGPEQPPAAAASTTAEPESDEAVQQRVYELARQIRDGYPEAWTAFGTWCNQRTPKVTSLDQQGPALRGLARKLEKLLEAAKERAAEQAAAAPEPDGATATNESDIPTPEEPAEAPAPAAETGGTTDAD